MDLIIPTSSPARVLVVEDLPAILSGYIRIFAGVCEIVPVLDYPAAAHALRTQSFTGVLTDWSLPGGNGGDVFYMAIQLQLPVIVISSNVPDDWDLCPVMQKPVTPQQCQALVTRLAEIAAEHR
ncbi:MAG: hypothetical protein V3U11_03120 [Planctomycetota bacterium]